MAQPANQDTVNRSMLIRSLASIEEITAMISHHLLQDKALAQREVLLQIQLKEIEFQRKQLKTTIEASQASKKAMEAAAEGLKNVLSPIRSFPAEILLRIFHFMALEEKKSHVIAQRRWLNVPKALPVPILLGQVCSQWRYIANENAKLWFHVVVRTPNSRDPDPALVTARTVSRTSQWMRHGDRSSKEIFTDFWSRSEGTKTLVSIIGSHQTPWKSLEICIGGCEEGGQWDIQAVSATNVTIYRPKGTPASSLTFLLPLFKFATTLTITGTPPAWGNTPWASLRSLSILPFASSGPIQQLNFGSTDFWELLNAAPNLKKLSLSFVTLSHAYSGATRIVHAVVHRSLQSLSLHLHHFEQNSGPFGVQLTAPLLCSITLHTLATPIQSSGSKLIIGQLNQITSFSLRNLKEYDIPKAINLLLQLPNIGHLEVEGRHIEKLFVHVNAFYKHIPPTFPQFPLAKLANITLDTTDIRGETLIELLETRFTQLEGSAEGIQAIKNIVIYESPGVTPEDWKHIGTLLERGRGLGASFPREDVDMEGL